MLLVEQRATSEKRPRRRTQLFSGCAQALGLYNALEVSCGPTSAEPLSLRMLSSFYTPVRQAVSFTAPLCAES
jgi:hypothetical protein